MVTRVISSPYMSELGFESFMDLFHLMQDSSKDNLRLHVPEAPVHGNLSLESDPWSLFCSSCVELFHVRGKE